MDKDEFYVGYATEHPKKTMAFFKKFILLIALIIVAVAFIFSYSQKPFENSSFELGTLTELEGVLYQNPYPILRTTLEGDATKDILLLGFGKFGAEQGLAEIFKDQKSEGVAIKLQGTLIYYDGKTLLQLQPNITDTYKIMGQTNTSSSMVSLGTTKLRGEVIDPKCYFGVMKPGYGKIHRSCAARCISGGIPPVFLCLNSEKEASYFLIADTHGAPINNEILDHIGKSSEIQGELFQLGDWMQIRVNPEDITTLNTASDIY